MFLAPRPNLPTAGRSQPVHRIGIPRIDAAASELFNVRVTLAPSPSSDWEEAFIQFENGVERSTLMVENPTMWGNALLLCGVREMDVEPWLKLIDTKIAGANVQYAAGTMPPHVTVQEPAAVGATRQGAQARAEEIARQWEAPDA